MESKSQSRFSLGRQSSLAPERDAVGGGDEVEEGIDSGIRLMYSANEGDLEGMKELLESGTIVNFRDIDGRTALHVAACQGHPDVVELLLGNGAEVNVEDRWGSTPLADAIHYQNNDVVKLLEAHGAKLPMAPMHVQNAREIPEYEIDPKELDFSNSVDITKGTFCIASWRGTQVAVKRFGEALFTDEEKVWVDKHLGMSLHYCIVGFDNFALDIARGMNYLHEHKPEAIIHRDLEPSNILRDDSGHLKVADFGLSKLMRFTKSIKEDKPLTSQETSWRYVAPEVLKNEEYDTMVDVFSFALILQEMIEGCPPFPTKQEIDVAKAYAANERPPFRAPVKLYAHGLRELIEDCWSENPARRPTFRLIISKLEEINQILTRARRWKVRTLKCFQNLEAILKIDHSNSKSRSSRSTLYN
ncbi:PREDICTED: mitogen-activated protein kinase kinase kinase isoform X4 [Ipomoea nil]|uniref:mitogen-activated protein kinase kinase kinase isoform X4 n=1 Tax=Ipomoea nil TaxID=35883 RepID=UPI00090107B7|nr:PREDICTED: mitogen-activated protein kinase kinase kinase isoform X4 [Ipomoea nil]